MLALADGAMHVCQDGPETGPVLLLIHGSAASAGSFDALLPPLTRTHRVIRVDLLGCGASAEPTDDDYTVPAQARRVGEALDRLGVERAVVVGHSSGGIVATALADRRAELVTALALINTGPRLDAYIAPPPPAVDPAQWSQLTDDELRPFVGAAFSRPGFEIPHHFLDELRRMRLSTLAATLQAGSAYLAERPLPDRLKVLGKPLLVVFGVDDRRWRSSSADGYRVVPGARVEMLAGVGHTPIIEDPDRTAEALLSFAARFDDQPSGRTRGRRP